MYIFSEEWREGLKTKLESLKLTLSILFSSFSGLFGVIIVAIYIAIAIIVKTDPSLLGIHTNVNVLIAHPVSLAGPGGMGYPPSKQYPFGVIGTPYGLNLYTGVMKAIPVDIWLSIIIVVPGGAIGAVIGVLASYYGGWFDEILMRITDIFFSIPFLVLAIVASATIANSTTTFVIILIIIWWPIYARLVRSQAISIKELTFIEAARASGVKDLKIIFKHILPNTTAPLFVQFSLDLASIMILLSSLDFIGVRIIPPGLPELGYLSAMGSQVLVIGQWWGLIIPGFAILLFALAMNMIGDAMRDALDPRLRR
ncbi:MAG: ABC transporter permease [Candidatus Thermoplasmatota archaeon]|nr:ABC transporter permease [Candidatus Thermoplasmatota archaeon]MCL5964066.1 ABC transporter permease [Candidatus Thermoplasmatota archaeon]